MVNERIRIWAEEEYKMDINQNGFRKGRSTMDNIGILINSIKESWGKGRKVMAAFIDVKSVYDNVKHDLMVQGLRSMQCPGRAARYIEAWLKEREIEIHTLGGDRIEMKLKKGLPQGSVLSPLLYNLYTRDIGEGLREAGVRILQYADDIVVFVEFEKRNEGKRRIEEAVKKLKENLDRIGLSIAMEKTQIVKFLNSRRRGGLTREEFRVDNERIEECLGGVRKGTGPETILKVFVAVIRSVIEYGAPFYLNDKRNRERIQKVHNAGTRIALGYRMSTPINVMETEAGIMDLEIRVRTLTEWYIARKFWSRDEDTVGALENRIRNSMEEEIREEIKIKMFGRNENVIEIHTDGSRTESRKSGGGAVVIRENGKYWEKEGFTAPAQCSVYTIEMTAISKAVEIAEGRFRGRDVLILSDSLSTIGKLAKDNRGQDIGDEIDRIRNKIKKRNFEIEKKGEDMGKVVVAWVPAHVGIEGNERADRMAKEATTGDADFWVKFTLKDFRRVIRERRWIESTETHLRQGEYTGGNILRRDGTTKFMVVDPYCEVCDKIEDVEHLLWECNKYDGKRNEFVNRMNRCRVRRGCDFYETKEMGEAKPLRLIGAFIKQCGLKL
ncbi:uncharacterized protein LOC143266618 [Megachile rotundata]|uniref:uncharacterized protein LOC143266618 n=1 Tax=Megachile rotundata TaxID=143995 RepID=UPI003FD4819C